MSQKKSNSSCHKKSWMLQKYTLPFDFVNRVELLLPYKSYAKRQCKERFLRQLNINVHERYKIRNKELINELKKLDDELNHVHTVTEYDEEFFKIVNGRPLFHCINAPFKSHTNILDKRFRILQETAYREDSALNIDINFRIEKTIYDKTLQRFFEEAKTFDKFIMEDYQKSMRVLDKEEKLSLKLDSKIAELHNLADESFTIMSRLLGLDYKYGLQQKYGRFLYYLSPPMWRASNREFARSIEIEAKGFDFGNSHDEDTFNALFEKMRKECCISPTKPVLYFTRPHDLIDVFEGIEKHLLYHFSREAELVPRTKSIKDAIRLFKLKIDQDSAVVTASIKDFKNRLSLCEERCNEMKEKFFKILHGFFYEAVGTADVLKFVFHLEFCYSTVFQDIPMNMEMITIAKAIELMYMDYSKRLDAIQSGSIRRAMQRCMDMNIQKMDRAKKAAKELRLFNRLERELLRAHNLLPEGNLLETIEPKYIPKKKLKCEPSKCHVYKRNYQSLNDAEIEYLTLFTDWNKNEDPALYLQSLNIDKGNSEDA